MVRSPMWLSLAVAAVTLVVSEPAMTLVHRWIFHGPLWCVHRSHHAAPTVRRLVSNDLLWAAHFTVTGALISLSLWFGDAAWARTILGIALGAAGYGLAYILAHDGVAHG